MTSDDRDRHARIGRRPARLRGAVERVTRGCRASWWCSIRPRRVPPSQRGADRVGAGRHHRQPVSPLAVDPRGGGRRALGPIAASRAGRGRPRRISASPSTVATRCPAATAVGIRWPLHLSSFDRPGGAKISVRICDRSPSPWRRGCRRHTDDGPPVPIPQVGVAWATCPSVHGAGLAGRSHRSGWSVLGVLDRPPSDITLPCSPNRSPRWTCCLPARAMCGLGVDWFAEEYKLAGIEFPSAIDGTSTSRLTARAAVAVGQAARRGSRDPTVEIGEALAPACPIQEHIPMGGWVDRESSARRDWWPSTPTDQPVRRARGCRTKVAVLARHCEEVGRDRGEIDVSHLSMVLIGRDHRRGAHTIERLRPKRMGAE